MEKTSPSAGLFVARKLRKLGSKSKRTPARGAYRKAGLYLPQNQKEYGRLCSYSFSHVPACKV